MLMLQVTSLALSKKMADLNQSASTTMVEQKDFMRAIVSLQQQHSNLVSLPKSSLASSRSRISQRLSFRRAKDDYEFRDCLPSHEDSAKLTSTARSFTQSMSPKTLTKVMKQTSETSRSSGTSMGESNSDGKPPSMTTCLGNMPYTAFDIILSESVDDDSTTMRTNPSEYTRSTPKTSIPCEDRDLPDELSSDLQLFLLKPIVRDYFDKIELS